MTMTAKKIRMTMELNGTDRTIVVEPRATLANALREECGLTGTKDCCGSECTGGCTVLVDSEPVRSCMMFAVQAHSASVTTVEGLGEPDVVNALQEAFMSAGAVHSGYCTPGFLMLAAGALTRYPHMDDAAVDRLVAANVSSSQSYDAIAAAVRAARDATAGRPAGDTTGLGLT